MTQEKAAEIIDFSASREAVGVDEAPSAGAFLASVRKAAGFSLFAVSDATKVKIEHLEAIEANNAAALPIPAYAIGFVKSYARFLDLDEEAIASKFKKDIGADKIAASAAAAQSAETGSAASPHISDGARMVSIFGIIAILTFAFWIVFQVTNSPANRGATGATAAPEQRVRLGTAPLPTLTPRQPAPQTTTPAEETVVDPLVENAVPDRVVAEVETANIDAPTGSNIGNMIEAAPDPIVTLPDAATISDPIPLSEAGSTMAENNAADDAETNSASPLAPIATLDVNPSPDVMSASASVSTLVLDAPVAETLTAVSPPVDDTRTRIEQIIPEPVIVDARLLRSIAPQYPNRCARNATDLERVTVVFDVTAQGRPTNVRVADTSNGCFDDAAISTLRRWRFEPKTVDGAARADLGKRATLNFRR